MRGAAGDREQGGPRSGSMGEPGPRTQMSLVLDLSTSLPSSSEKRKGCHLLSLPSLGVFTEREIHYCSSPECQVFTGSLYFVFVLKSQTITNKASLCFMGKQKAIESLCLRKQYLGKEGVETQRRNKKIVSLCLCSWGKFSSQCVPTQWLLAGSKDLIGACAVNF